MIIGSTNQATCINFHIVQNSRKFLAYFKLHGNRMVAYKYFGNGRLVSRWLELSTLVVDAHDWKLMILLLGEGEGQYIDGSTRRRDRTVANKRTSLPSNIQFYRFVTSSSQMTWTKLIPELGANLGVKINQRVKM